MGGGADRDDEATVWGELALQGLRNCRTARRDDNSVERRLLGQPLGSVAADDLDIAVAEALEPRPGKRRQLGMALDCVHLPGDAPEDGHGIARACAHFEHLVAGLDLGELDHAGDDIGLGDSLARLDGQGPVLVREFLQMLRHEGLARHLAHGGKHKRISDAAGGQVPRDHDGAVPGVPAFALFALGGECDHAE